MSSSLRLDWCSHEAAKYACEKWHYSGTVPAAKRLLIGAWEDKVFIGCLIFSTGSGGACNGSRYGLSATFQMAELQRVALSAHKNEVSRIVAIAAKMVARKCPELRALISFADPGEGHHGGIYQGGNWVYLGLSAQTRKFKLTDGRWVHERCIRKQWGRHVLAARLNTGEFKRFGGKHRYLMPLDDEMRARIAPLAKPYPKRAGSIVADAPATHAGEGGSVPTPALHTRQRAKAHA
jgi:hypothetical protein